MTDMKMKMQFGILHNTKFLPTISAKKLNHWAIGAVCFKCERKKEFKFHQCQMFNKHLLSETLWTWSDLHSLTNLMSIFRLSANKGLSEWLIL